MSIISVYEIDNSSFLCKRFASLATSYFDEPSVAKTSLAQVPLENLFRILEMYRYDAFSDESRIGVLAIGDAEDYPTVGHTESTWHTAIKEALDIAMHDTFGEMSKDQAVSELQEALRSLVGDRLPLPAQSENAKRFFTTFNNALV